jgi:hypothetical protein
VYAAVLDFNRKWAGFRAAVGTLRSVRAQRGDDAGLWQQVQGEREEG